MRHQCKILGINRSSFYYRTIDKDKDKELEKMILEIYRENPFYGYRRITVEFQKIKKLDNNTIADAILDRIVYSSHRIEMGRESMKKRNQI